MKRWFTFCLFLGFVLSAPIESNSAAGYVHPQNQNNPINLDNGSLIKPDMEALEFKMGRKPTLKEKIAFKALQWKLKKQAAADAQQAEGKTNNFAIRGFIAGLLGVLSGLLGLFGALGSAGIIFFILLALILGIIGIIFSAVALNKIKRNPEVYKGKVLAGFGMALGIILAVSILGLVIGVAIGFA